MARNDDDRDDPQDLDLDWAGAQDDEEGEDTVECPHCGEAVYWESPRCPECGAWITNADSAAAQRSRSWLWPVVVALLVVAILVIWLRIGA